MIQLTAHRRGGVAAWRLTAHNPERVGMDTVTTLAEGDEQVGLGPVTAHRAAAVVLRAALAELELADLDEVRRA